MTNNLQVLSSAPADDMMSLRDCAIDLQMFRTLKRRGKDEEFEIPDTRGLLRMARMGRFPRCLVVSPRHVLVKRSEFVAWKLGQWTSTPAERSVIKQAALDGDVRVNKRARAREEA